MESFVIFVAIISLLIWLFSTLYTLFVSSPYKRDDNADFGEIDFEKAKQELKGGLEYPYCETATINESGTLELVCKYATYSVNIQERKLVIESDPRPFVKPGNVVEEKDCLEAYLVKTLLPEADSNPPKALEHFHRYVQFRLLRRISGWLFLVLLILCALNESGLSVINVMDVWKSKGVSQMYFTDYSEEITIGEALRAACSNCKWQSDKIGDNLYAVTFIGYGADGSLLTILFQTNRSECSIESITLDQEDITWTQGFFLAALYESIKDDDSDDEVSTLPETMNGNIYRDADGTISNDTNDMENEANGISEAQIASDDRKYLIGESVQLYEQDNDNQVINVTLTDWGRLYGASDGKSMYVDYTIKNIGEDSVTVGESLFDIYADNKKIDLLDGEKSIWSEEISKGREINGRLYADIIPNKYTEIEVECGDYIYLLWDASFVQSIMGSYSRQVGDTGANITIKQTKYGQLIIESECWKGSYYGKFNTENGLPCIVNADANLDRKSLEFDDLDSDKLIIYPEENGIYVEQIGSLWGYNTLSDKSELSFAGAYEKGLTEKPQIVEKPSDSELDDSYDSEVQGFSCDRIDNSYISDAVATSELTDSGQSYQAFAAVDGNKDTCWAEGVDGNGEGEFIKIKFTTTINLTEIYLLNGYMKNEDVYNKNGKIKRAELGFSDGTTLDADLQECSYQKAEDQTFSDCILLDKPISTDFLKITILEAEAGTKYDDICLSEIELWGNTDSDIE
ncbi:MAG: hypothetical protein K2H37_11235 [Lachnospiraceae bacterium]|nr:hypothetical protein [Lachnospiraceae bacterium]